LAILMASSSVSKGITVITCKVNNSCGLQMYVNSMRTRYSAVNLSKAKASVCVCGGGGGNTAAWAEGAVIGDGQGLIISVKRSDSHHLHRYLQQIWHRCIQQMWHRCIQQFCRSNRVSILCTGCVVGLSKGAGTRACGLVYVGGAPNQLYHFVYLVT
jgi:hypothetical protein